MKKAIVFAAAALMAAPAFASKARQTALGGAVTTNDDVQEVFVNPAKMFNFGDMLTIESTNEGGFFRSHGDSKYGVYFGNKSTSFDTMITRANALGGFGLLKETNPFEAFYGSKAGDMAWALSLKYSSSQDKVAAQKTKVNTMGLRAGVGTDMYEAYVSAGLAGKSEKEGGATAQSNPTFQVGGEYFMGDMTVYADVLSGGGKVTAGGNDTKLTSMNMTVGVESKVKGEGSHFFYGAALKSTELKVGDNAKETSMSLPVYAGIEADATSWMAVRGFVKQNVLVDDSKKVDATSVTTEERSGLNGPGVGFGSSLKLGKVTVDGSLFTGGKLDSSNLMGDVSLNYWF